MKYFYLSNKFLLLLNLGLFFSLASFAQSIRGRVTDASSKETLVGTSVLIKETGRSQAVQLDGYFAFKNLKPGIYTLQFRFISYKTQDLKVTVEQGRQATLNVTMDADTRQMNDVNITANGESTDKRARSLERNANQVVNVVSARNIEISPDITVANVMQRVSGVTIERSSSGEGRYPIIRGMEKRYINTLVNGIKISSPDNKNRFIPLDLFPAELLERLEVSKTLTPSMEGDAVGGTINLVMKDAPARKLFQVNFAAGYNTVFNGSRDFQQFDRSSINKRSPAEINGNKYAATPADFPVKNLNFTPRSGPVNTNFGLTYGDRFGKDNKLGFLISGSYQNNYTGNNSTFFLPNAQ